jgi:hypothetical protein
MPLPAGLPEGPCGPRSSFHVLYDLCDGAPDVVAEALGVAPAGVPAWRYVHRPHAETRTRGLDAPARFRRLDAAMEVLGSARRLNARELLRVCGRFG